MCQMCSVGSECTRNLFVARDEGVCRKSVCLDLNGPSCDEAKGREEGRAGKEKRTTSNTNFGYIVVCKVTCVCVLNCRVTS